MSYVTRRKSRRKFKHQPTNVDGLSQLLTKFSVTNNYGGDEWEDVPNSPKTSERYTRPASSSAIGSFNRRDDEHGSSSRKKRKDSIDRKGTGDTIAIGEIEEETHLDNISFRLGSTTYVMDDTGHWRTDTTDSDMITEVQKLHQSNARISQENNLLRVKNELLTDMIAKKTLRQEEVEQELQRLKKVLSKSSSRFSILCEKGYTV
ncbi:unnamed protein product [Orchesella dallaii]|uniref:PRKC apoptosis WT1 regulator protein n=1 Tax=Orchesella dallaii TaxID=48710 RepID=A0ABP1QFK5_9HEXA